MGNFVLFFHNFDCENWSPYKNKSCRILGCKLNRYGWQHLVLESNKNQNGWCAAGNTYDCVIMGNVTTRWGNAQTEIKPKLTIGCQKKKAKKTLYDRVLLVVVCS